MKIFITGGAGFIGSYLVNILLNKGHNVAIYDNFSNFINRPEYYNQMLKYRKKLLNLHADRIFQKDIRDKQSLVKSLKQYKPEIIVHLAGLPMARPLSEYANLMVPINMHGTHHVLEAFEETESARRIIYTSSSMAYGHFKQSPQAEHSLLSPTNLYGATKAAGEYFTKLSQKEWVIIRPTSVYGFTDCANRVTQLLIDAAIMNKTAWVVKSEALDFSYVEDVAEGFFRSIISPRAPGHTFNISRGQSRRASEFADELKKYFPNFSYEIRKPTSQQVYRGALDIELAQSILGYKPKYGMEDGIKKTIQLIKQFGQISNN